MDFFLNREMLYKHNFNRTMLRYVDAIKAKKIMSELHERIYTTHTNGHMMAHQALRKKVY